jgi:hypothetical protein
MGADQYACDESGTVQSADSLGELDSLAQGCLTLSRGPASSRLTRARQTHVRNHAPDEGGDDGHDGEHHDSCHIGSADQSEHEADEGDHDADMKQSKANRHIDLLRSHRCPGPKAKPVPSSLDAYSRFSVTPAETSKHFC